MVCTGDFSHVDQRKVGERVYKVNKRDEYFQSLINHRLVTCLSILAARDNEVICDFTEGSTKKE